jgi:uncharacterized membrane protein
MSVPTAASVYMRMSAADWLLMALGSLVLAALVFWLGGSLAGGRRGGGEPRTEAASALHLLGRRLAEGEISAEQHGRARSILTDDPNPTSVSR